MSGIALKFTSLLVRTVAKPISNTIKAQAKEHELFRRQCISFAQAVHHTEIKLRMNLLGEKKIKVRPLNDKKAIENGANFLSELFVFSVAGSLIFFESYRSRQKSNLEKAGVQDDLTLLQDEIESLKGQVNQLRERVGGNGGDLENAASAGGAGSGGSGTGGGIEADGKELVVANNEARKAAIDSSAEAGAAPSAVPSAAKSVAKDADKNATTQNNASAPPTNR